MIAVLRVAALLLTCCNAWHLVRHTTPLQLRAASDAVDASAEALAALRVPELKDKCRARGLRVSGTKAALIERLLDTDGADANAAEEGSWASLGLDGVTRQRLTHARPTAIQGGVPSIKIR